MNDLFEMKFFTLLSKTSPTEINAEIQNAYEEFIKYIVATSNSRDFSSAFRVLNFIRIEFVFIKESDQCQRGKKYIQNALFT